MHLAKALFQTLQQLAHTACLLAASTCHMVIHALLPLLLRLGAPLLQPLRMPLGTRLLQHLLQLRFIDSGFGHLMHIHCFGFRLRL